MLHECCMRGEWVNPLTPGAAYLHQCLSHHWSKKWIGAKSAPINFLNQCWLYIEKKPRNNLRWNICLHLRISLRKIEMKHFIEENWNEIVICIFLSNISRPQWLKTFGRGISASAVRIKTLLKGYCLCFMYVLVICVAVFMLLHAY